MPEHRLRGRSPLRFVASGLLAGRDHVVVDGAPRPGTVCTLSHWPGTPTPEGLWHDVSAGIVLRALERPDALPAGVDIATIDHYDTDGVIALALLCVEGLADEFGDLLVAAAVVGDFDVVRDRRAALVAFGLGALADPGRAAPALGVGWEGGHGIDPVACAATEALGILPALAADPDSHVALWRDEADSFDVSWRAVTEGWASIEERVRHDVAIVRVDSTHPDASRARWEDMPLHRAAVHSATDRLRVLTVADGRVELRYRYESWVRLVSRRPRPRVDLSGVAAELTRAEPGGARWTFDGAGAITGALHLAPGAVSGLDPDHVVEMVCQDLDRLDAGPPAWDPYAMGPPGG